MATHFGILAWRIPGAGEPGGLTSMGSHRVGHDWSDLAAAAVYQLPVIPLMLKKQMLNILWRPARTSGTNTPKRFPFHCRGLEWKSRKPRDTWSNRKIWPWSPKRSKQRLTEFCQGNTLVITNTLFHLHKTTLCTWPSPDGQYWN